jgi:uncharacterized delta-60 repeat protein
MNVKNIIIIILFNLISLSIFASADQFNTAFNGIGYTGTGAIWSNYYVNAAIMQPTDEKLIVIGMAKSSSAPQQQISLARFLSNGKLDTVANGGSGFGSSTPSSALGYILLPLDASIASQTLARGYAVALDAAGNIIVAGLAQYNGANNANLIIARFTPAGVPDTTFGIQGSLGITNTLQTSSQSAGYNLSGNVAGSSNGSSGSLGYITLLMNSQLAGYGVKIQSDNKIVVVGQTNQNQMIALRFLSNGALDTVTNGGSGFGTGSPAQGYIVGSSLGNSANIAYATTILDNGNILVAGQSSVNSGQMMLARLTPAGVSDTTFNALGTSPSGPGYVISNITNYGGAQANSLLVQQNGDLIIAGSNGLTAVSARYSANGVLNTTYGSPNGYVITTIADTIFTNISGITYDPNGKVLLIGYVQTSSGTDYSVIIRYNFDGSLDTTFSPTGYAIINTNGIPPNFGASIAIRSDGTLVVGAGIYNLGMGAMSFLGGGLPISQTPAIATYSSNVNLYQQFLYINKYAKVITDPTAQAATIAAVENILSSYETAYANQPNFNYLSYLYLNQLEIDQAQAALVIAYPGSAISINYFFLTLNKRIITLTVQQL